MTWLAFCGGALAGEPESTEAEPTEATALIAEAEPPSEAAPSEELHALPELSPFPETVTPASPHWDLEVLYSEKQYHQGLALAKARIAADPNDATLYWMAARFMFEIGEQIDRADDSVDKEAFYEEMYNLSVTGLEKRPGDPHLLFAKGLAEGRWATTRGVLASLFRAKDIEEAWLESASSDFRYRSIKGQEHLPCDTYIGLGVYFRLLPDWWIVQVLAGSRGDIDKSLAWLEKSDTCSPNRANVIKELGVSQLCKAERDKDDTYNVKGKATLERVLNLPIRTPRDELDRKHSAMLIADPSLACEYSRDGQQDLAEESLEK